MSKKKKKKTIGYGILSSHILGGCNPKRAPRRIDCGWPSITKEQCLARNCCYDNSIDDYNALDRVVNCFVKPDLGEYAQVGI